MATATTEQPQQQQQQPKVTLHWLEKSRSQRILWLLEECSVAFEVKTYKRAGIFAPPELKKVHPLGKSPVVTIDVPGRAEPLVVAESGFITEYLCDHFAPHLIPKRYKEGEDGKVGQETESWMRYRHFMHYGEGTLMTSLLMGKIINAFAGPQVPFFIKPVTRPIVSKMNTAFLYPNVKSNMEFVEAQLGSAPDGGPYLCGKDLTGADILMSFPLLAVREGMSEIFDKSKFPKTTEYLARLEKMDAYQRAIKKAEEASGGKYSVL